MSYGFYRRHREELKAAEAKKAMLEARKQVEEEPVVEQEETPAEPKNKKKSKE